MAMSRIIAGSAGGRRLLGPPGQTTRPTSERVREAIFNRLANEGLVEGAQVLDLYSGSGALGLEAVSRGASGALLVEVAHAAGRVLKRNVAASGLTGISVSIDRVEKVLGRPAPDPPFDLVLADPPYALGEPEIALVLERLAAGWLAGDAVVVLERSARTPEPSWPAGLQPYDDRTYGETKVWFAERVDGPEGSAEPAAG